MKKCSLLSISTGLAYNTPTRYSFGCSRVLLAADGAIVKALAELVQLHVNRLPVVLLKDT
jgi:hypothetical protein